LKKVAHLQPLFKNYLQLDPHNLLLSEQRHAGLKLKLVEDVQAPKDISESGMSLPGCH
jgi:hypothetical protein